MIDTGESFPGHDLKDVPFRRVITEVFFLRFLYRFGYNWDCDPVISVTLWVSLLIPLFLLFVIIWATTMLTSVHTPDKFDNPHGKQIIVPTTE